jgi:glycosyltransferase involved in cell wall biosynthesis
MGRGRASSKWRYFSGEVKRVDGLPLIYIPFTSIPALSQALSSIALVYVILNLRLRGFYHLVFYNRTTAFLPSLLFSLAMGYKNTLDLEDGEYSPSGSCMERGFIRVKSYLYDGFCGRALLACSALKELTSIRPTLCYYGTVFNFFSKCKLQSENITVLMSGTLCHETGAHLLIEAIKKMRLKKLSWLNKIRFEISGTGDSLNLFRQLALEIDDPKIIVHGRLSNLDYEDVLKRADIGLSLKLINGPYANTTFPSKVIEYAAAGLLVITTDMSDVRKVIGNGALYIDRDDPEELIKYLEFISANLSEVDALIEISQNAVKELCAPNLVGIKLCDFIFR